MNLPVVRWIGERIQELRPGSRNIRYLSLFSGIGTATLAFEALGWRCLAFAELAKFPSAILRDHWPRVPNAGDVSQFDWSKYQGKCDLMIGGAPCQSFSTAGLRRSLWDERGSLTLNLAKAIHVTKPTWAIVENVPGLLDTDDGAFGEFLGELVGADVPLRPPLDGRAWPTCGIISGQLYGAAWRVLDAQYFGVPQRRRRVFVSPIEGIGDLRRRRCSGQAHPQPNAV